MEAPGNLRRLRRSPREGEVVIDGPDRTDHAVLQLDVVAEGCRPGLQGRVGAGGGCQAGSGSGNQ